MKQRIIKFRCWDKEQKKMDDDLHRCNVRWCLEHNERFILMQYTGLKDKNSIEIYEGDIIKVYLTKYQVGFKNGGFVSFNKKEKFESPMYSIPLKKTKIISNIYENRTKNLRE